MRQHTIRRKARKARRARKTKTLRRGGAGDNNDPSYNVWSRMYGGPVPIANPNAQSRMYGGPIPIANAPIVNPNQREEAPIIPNANPAPNQNAPIVQAYYNNRHNANVLPIPAEPVFQIPFDMQREMERIQSIGIGRFGDITWATSRMAELTRDFILSLGDEQVLTSNSIMLYNSHGGGPYTSTGYLYVITRKHVYMSEFRFQSAGIDMTRPSLRFKTIYEFAEPLSAQLCSIFISYCNKNITLFHNGYQGTGHNESDLELHRSKLEAIMNAIPSI